MPRVRISAKGRATSYLIISRTTLLALAFSTWKAQLRHALHYTFDPDIIVLNPCHRYSNVPTVSNVVAKVHNTVHCVFVLIDKKHL